jgi:hypothetical protein
VRIPALIVSAIPLLAASPSAAEELLIRGMGRTVGWVVALADGKLGFRDCTGRVVQIIDGSVDQTTKRCRSSGESIAVQGIVRSLDRSSKVLVVEDQAGDGHAFYVGKIADAAVLEDLEGGVEVEVAGPFAGRATEIVRR